MKIKKYTVGQMQEAIQLIKQELGPEAVIVSSHRVKGPGWLGWFKRNLEVTAVLDDTPLPEPVVKTLPPPEEPVVQPEPEPAPPKPSQPVMPAEQRVKDAGTRDVFYTSYQLMRSQIPGAQGFTGYIERVKLPETKFQPLLDEALLKMAENDLEAKVKPMTNQGLNHNSGNETYRRWLETLLDIDIQEGVARALLDAALRDLKGEVSDDLIRIALINKTTEILKSAYRRPEDARFMTFVGPPGVGKTTTLTKLATKFKLLEKKKVALITVYTYRYGSADQLKIYGETLDVPVEVVMTPAELRQAVEQHADKDHILIDTVGRTSKNTGQVLELKGFLEVIPEQQDIFLVLAASTKDRDLFRTIRDFRIAHFNKFIFTKTDETETLGSMLNVVSRTGLPIAYYTDGQSIPDDLEKAYPKKLAHLLFRSADRYEESQT
ncbi:flagellar biosynthetic protein FlhF [Desulfotomaculum nigrificans CO-1-SRB]|uniref:Flagellar biosynthesis protein FlhF n=1 Tax=Desulfotomaculum nigrificans (strain DSM 14880 / VKM B-2319 / CO-1-SRB) TaxID=868595 RepID=F6B7Z1_DESCC|nr:flagellar biosynthesis protein FlhF [Desulfotomaculum nigrificans]AEF94628.1 flagellar biosynthetic protein FlhF [Desulfotomaculum nigrificans CO-1-SRB]